MSETILVTGANRGLGLELVRQYAADGWRVFACSRQPETATELRELAGQSGGRISVHRLDVADRRQIEALREELRGQPLDVLFSNAGVVGGEAQSFGQVEEGPWLDAFIINAIAPLMLVQAFAGQVAASRRKVIALMGTQMASLADNRGGGYYIYRSTKAALHMVGRSISVDLRPQGIITVLLHPGWVRTRMGGEAAALTPKESVDGLRRVVASLTRESSGRFFNFDGRELPW